MTAYPMSSWFETHGVAALLTMRVLRPHPEERAFARVSKDEATELENALVRASSFVTRQGA
jgi:hypothetical protein